MSKSSLRKDQEKSVTTNLSIGWTDAVTTSGAIVESGSALYIIPRKGEAQFQRMLWTYQLKQDPGNFEVVYAILRRAPVTADLGISEEQMVERALISAVQSWRAITAIGVVQVSNTMEVDMKKMVMSRRSNLQDDDEFAVVPAYRSGSTVAVGQSGILFVKETLFQEIFKDDLDEWNGYTFEESAS